MCRRLYVFALDYRTETGLTQPRSNPAGTASRFSDRLRLVARPSVLYRYAIPMSEQPHPGVLAVHTAADVVTNHVHQAPQGSFWRHWFEKPGERHFADEVRAFVACLEHLLDVPPQVLTREVIVSIGADVDRVVKRLEASIEEPGSAGTDVAGSLVPAVYVIRARYEELYNRGARFLR